MDPSEILPKELWKLILDKLTHPRTKIEFINSNLLFEKWFAYEKTQLKFPAVLYTVMTFSFRNNDKLLGSTFLNCRLVSSECCKVVDRFVRDCYSISGRPPWFIRPINRFNSGKKVRQFLVSFGETKTRIPIVSRSVTIHASSPLSTASSVDKRDYEATFSQIVKLCSIIGKDLRVLHLKVIVRCKQTVCKDQEGKFFVDLLKNLTELREFTCQILGKTVKNEQSSNEGWIQLPELPRLTTLTILSKCPLFFNQSGIDLKCYFPQLHQLAMLFSSWKDEYNHGINLFVDLRALFLFCIPILVAEERTKYVKMLNSRDWPLLKVLSLHTQGIYDQRRVPLLVEERGRMEGELVERTLKELPNIRIGSNWTSQTFKEKPGVFIFMDNANNNA